MTVNCDIIKDLLPLYADGVCSEESAKMIEEHLKSCEKCKSLLANIKEDDTIGDLLPNEETVMEGQKKVFRKHNIRLSATVGGLFALPIFVCLVVNLATGLTLDWFFIVLASLMLGASLVVVPLFLQNNKFLWMSGLSVVSLGLLLGTISLYTHGRWFLFTYSAVLFGFSVAVLPFLLREPVLANKVKGYRALIVTGVGTLTSAVMLLSLYAYLDSVAFLRLSLSLYLPLLILCLCVVILRQFFKNDKSLYLGLSSLVTGVFTLIFESFSNALLGVKTPLPAFPNTLAGFPFSRGSSWLFFLAFTVLGTVLIVISLIKRGKKHEK